MWSGFSLVEHWLLKSNEIIKEDTLTMLNRGENIACYGNFDGKSLQNNCTSSISQNISGKSSITFYDAFNF